MAAAVKPQRLVMLLQLNDRKGTTPSRRGNERDREGIALQISQTPSNAFRV